MPVVAKIEGVKEVIAALRKAAARVLGQSRADARSTDPNDNVSVVVGFTASYAIYVHENLEAYHKVGQAKYLEQPVRERQAEIGMMARNNVQSGKTLAQALLIAGLFIQREAQLLCPVDMGLLKNSAYTLLERE